MELVRTLPTLSIEAITNAANIVVGCSSEWSTLLVDLGKRMCNSVERRSILFYESLFTRINLWLPLFDEALENCPSQIQSGSLANMKVL